MSFAAILIDALSRTVAPCRVSDFEADPDPSAMWVRVRRNRGTMPQQGWKLHVSASIASAEEVLRRALPVLLAEDVAFKIAASLERLRDLNEAWNAALSQIGKFITVYPNDDAQAVRLAIALNEATLGLRGPSISSDRPLAPGSLVHYRYGICGDRQIRTLLGASVSAIETPDGLLVEDERLTRYKPPDWAVDPFAAAGIAAELPVSTPLIGGRYLAVSLLDESPRGAVYLGVEIDTPRSCVLKLARHDALMLSDGRDARDRLRHEAAVLACLAPDPRFPAVLEMVEQDQDLFLAIEDFSGLTLEQNIHSLLIEARHPSVEKVIGWARELAAIIDTVHSKGFVYRDLKSANCIILPDGHLRVVDFDIAHQIGSQSPRYGRGTRGYMSPQQEAGAMPAFSDDIYSFGAVLYFILTGAEPSHAPDPFNLLALPLSSMNPTAGVGLERLIARCLQLDPCRRFSSMAEVDSALRAIDSAASLEHGVSRRARGALESEERLKFRDLARLLGDTLCRIAQPAPDSEGLVWKSTHPEGHGIQSLDINTGTSGPVLALAELVAELVDPEHEATLAKAAHFLVTARHCVKPILPGLYIGEAGIGAALLRAGQVLGDQDLVAAAAERSRLISTLPHASPDLFHGSAGRLRFHLLVWDETGDPEHLSAAIAAGEFLAAAAKDARDEALCWTIPPGYSNLSGQANLGYAHGAAGIGCALLDLFQATQNERFLAAANGAAVWLARNAVPALDDGSGLAWPVNEGEPPYPAFWCHGATGIGRFFLHASELGVFPDASELVLRAARTVAVTRWVNPTQCHGLAGNIEFLIDVFRATGDESHLAAADSIGEQFEAFKLERDGLLVWSSEAPHIVSPDYMVGYAGALVCLLRLSQPERLPHQLTRRGFRRCVPGSKSGAFRVTSGAA